MLTFLIFIVILGLIVFIHEFGHFIFAKKAGIHVYEFSLGFGPKLFSFRRKNDETEYMVKLIPLGGYVALAGETDDEDEDKDKVPEDKKLYNKSFIRQFTVMIAGVFNNFVLGFILFFIVGFINGPIYNTNDVVLVNEKSALYESGLREGDKITSINGTTTNDYDDIILEVASSDTTGLTMDVVDANGKDKVVKLKPYKADEITNDFSMKTIKEDKYDFLASVKYGGKKFVATFKQCTKTIWYLIRGKVSINKLSGPVGIYEVVGKVRSSFISLLLLTALLSINVGFMNILPFPAFDGGRAFLLIIEKITRKKVPLKVESIINGVGFVLLMILMVYITIKDVLNLF